MWCQRDCKDTGHFKDNCVRLNNKLAHELAQEQVMQKAGVKKGSTTSYWKIVQYSFCKSPLEIVVVLPICILLHWLFVFCILFCGPALWALNWVVIRRTKFDILWHTMLHPIWGVLYIFYYINLVLPTFCHRVAVLFVDNNMYTHLVWLCCGVIWQINNSCFSYDLLYEVNCWS